MQSDTNSLFWLFWILFTGASIGSFIAASIFRWFKEDWTLTQPSACATCYHKLRWFELVPLVSYLALRAHCRYCGALIPVRNFFLEVFCGLWLVALYLAFGFSWQFLEYAVFSYILVTIAYVDLDSFLIPIPLVAALGVLGPVFAAIQGQPVWPRIIGGIAGFTTLWSIAWLSTTILRRVGRIEKQQAAMGDGDPALFGAIGAFVGLKALFWVLFLASVYGVAYGLGQKVWSYFHQALPQEMDDDIPEGALPFGPFLALASLTYVVWQIKSHFA